MTSSALPLILLAGFCGGSVYPLIKIAEQYDIPKFAYIFWESVFIVTILATISLLKNKRDIFRRSELPYYSFCAITNIVIPQSLFFLIAPNLEASIMSLIIVLTPLLVYLALIVFFQETVKTPKIIGLALGFIGVGLLFAPSLSDMDPVAGSVFWLLFALLLPLNYAVNRIFVTHLQPAETSPIRLSFGLFSGVALISGAAMMATQDLYIPFMTPNYGDLALLSHAILMVLFYISFFVISKSGAVNNSLSFYIAPLVGTLWGIFFFAEALTLTFTLAALCVLTALTLVTKKTSA